MKRFVSKTSSGRTLPIEGDEKNRLDDLVIVHVRQQVLKFLSYQEYSIPEYLLAVWIPAKFILQ